MRLMSRIIWKLLAKNANADLVTITMYSKDFAAVIKDHTNQPPMFVLPAVKDAFNALTLIIACFVMDLAILLCLCFPQPSASVLMATLILTLLMHYPCYQSQSQIIFAYIVEILSEIVYLAQIIRHAIYVGHTLLPKMEFVSIFVGTDMRYRMSVTMEITLVAMVVHNTVR